MYLRRRPGIYGLGPAHGPNGLIVVGPNSAPRTDTGKGMTGRQIQQMLTFLELYLEGGPASNDAAAKFDRKLMTDAKDIKDLIEDKDKRRYAKNSNQVDGLEARAKVIKEQHLTNLDVRDVDSNFVGCPMVVGWSVNIKNRCLSHLKNTQSTHIFGFVHTYTRFSLPFNDRFPEPYRFSLFPIFKKIRI